MGSGGAGRRAGRSPRRRDSCVSSSARVTRTPCTFQATPFNLDSILARCKRLGATQQAASCTVLSVSPRLLALVADAEVRFAQPEPMS
jgi:hypothetical protein